MKKADVIIVPWGQENASFIINMWCGGMTAEQISEQSGYSSLVIRMILKRKLKLRPVGK